MLWIHSGASSRLTEYVVTILLPSRLLSGSTTSCPTFDKSVTHHLFGGEFIQPYTSLQHAERETLCSRPRGQVIYRLLLEAGTFLYRHFPWIISKSLSHRLSKQEASEGDSSEEPDVAEDGNRSRTARDQRPKPDWYKSSCQLYSFCPTVSPLLKRHLHLTGSFTMIETWILDQLGGYVDGFCFPAHSALQRRQTQMTELGCSAGRRYARKGEPARQNSDKLWLG